MFASSWKPTAIKKRTAGVHSTEEKIIRLQLGLWLDRHDQSNKELSDSPVKHVRMQLGNQG
jgi:hypothetical protein